MGEIPRVDLICPVNNEARQIGPFLERVAETLAGTEVRWTVVFVDDGSTDNTVAVIDDYAEAKWPVRVLVLSRNFGKEAALTSGLDHAEGDAVVPIDVDLQDPPEVIPALLARWQAGADVVALSKSVWVTASSGQAAAALDVVP